MTTTMRDLRGTIQRDLFEPRARARRGDPSTSHAAATVVDRTISEACRAVYAALTLVGPCSDEELQLRYDTLRVEYDWPAQRCVRKRRKDLVDAGFARFTGRKVMNPVGLAVCEWAVTDKSPEDQ